MLGTLWLATTLYNFNQTPYLQVLLCLKFEANSLNQSWCYFATVYLSVHSTSVWDAFIKI